MTSYTFYLKSIKHTREKRKSWVEWTERSVSVLVCVVSLLLLVLHLYSLHFTSFSNSVLPFVCPFSSCQPVLTEHSLSVCPSVQTSLSAPTSSSHPLSHPWLALLRDDFCHRLKKIKIILGLKKQSKQTTKLKLNVEGPWEDCTC